MAWTTRDEKRKQRVKAEINIRQLMADFGYPVHVTPLADSREEQFPCDLHGDGIDNTPSARVYTDNTWYCVSQKDPVLTESGWVPLGDVGEVPLLDGVGVFQTPLKRIDQGVRSCLCIRTRAGYQVTVTPNHEVAVQNQGWVRADRIRPGDIVEVPKPNPRFPKDLTLPSSVQDLNARSYKGHPKLNLPSEWSLPLGEAMGYVFGDGFVISRTGKASSVVGVVSNEQDAENVRSVFSQMQEWAGGRGYEAPRRGQTKIGGKQYIENMRVFSIGNDGFQEWFCRLGLDKKKPASERRLPFSLWGAPKVALIGFLRGVYAADGSVFRPAGRSGVRVCLYSVSERFLQDVQLILLQFGVHSRLYPPAKKRPGGVRYLQLATGKDVLQFREHIGVANLRKQGVLDSYQYNPRGARPFKPVVERVTETKALPVGDLSMPGDPSFVAGGIRVHNCFVCDKTRDTIATVQAKKGLSFMAAIEWLEQRGNLPPLPFDPEDLQKTHHTSFEQVLLDLMGDTGHEFGKVQKRVESYLFNVTQERDLPLEEVTRFWDVHDKVCHMVAKEQISDFKGAALLAALLGRLKEAYARP